MKNKKNDTRNVYISHEFRRWQTPFYCKTQLNSYEIYSLVYLVTYIFEELTPIDRVGINDDIASESEVINILVSLGFVTKAQCGMNVEFDQIIDIAEMEGDNMVIVHAMKLLSKVQKNSLFEVIINERLTTCAGSKEFCEQLKQANEAVVNKDNTHTWDSMSLQGVNYDMYKNEVLHKHKKGAANARAN